MLKGEKVYLTGIRNEDSDRLFSWINDAETVRFNAPYNPVTREQHDAWFSSIGRSSAKVLFAIRPIGSQEIVGTVQLIDIHPVHQTAELTIRIGNNADRGKGYGTEALKLLVQFAFEDLNLIRVWLRVFSTNERAIKAYHRAGFAGEGTMRSAAWIGGKRVDELIMACVRD